MKATSVSLSWGMFIVLAVWALTSMVQAEEPTALQLIKEGNRYVSEDAKGKVVQVRSEKSIGSLTPNIWYVVYYDPDATFKATEVKFGAGKKLEVKRPLRVLEYVKADKVFDRTRLNVDSDAAIKTATAEPLLKNVTIKAVQLSLDSSLKSDLSVESPVWQVRLWAARLSNPNEAEDIGEVYLSAADGRVIKIDLHLDRLD